MEIFAWILIIYLFFVFLLSRLVIPHLGFFETEIPDALPNSMVDKIEELKKASNSPKDLLDKAYEYLGTRYHSGRLKTITCFSYLFLPLEKIWEKEGYIPCAQSSFLLKIFLVKSGFFKKSR